MVSKIKSIRMNNDNEEVIKTNNESYVENKQINGAYDMLENNNTIAIWNQKHKMIVKIKFAKEDTGIENIIIDTLADSYLRREKAKIKDDKWS